MTLLPFHCMSYLILITYPVILNNDSEQSHLLSPKQRCSSLLFHKARVKIHRDALRQKALCISYYFQILSFLRILWHLVPNEPHKTNVALWELSRFFGVANIVKEPSKISQYLYEYVLNIGFCHSEKKNKGTYNR